MIRKEYINREEEYLLYLILFSLNCILNTWSNNWISFYIEKLWNLILILASMCPNESVPKANVGSGPRGGVNRAELFHM